MIKSISSFYKLISCVLLIAILSVSLPQSLFAVSNDGEELGSVSEIEENAYDPNNIGTYNFGTDLGVKHFIKDVLPYWIYGNSEKDTTLLKQRIFGN